MSANPQRRRLLGLLAATPLAAAVGVQPTSALGRARTLSLGVGAEDRIGTALGGLKGHLRGPGLQGIGAAIERAHPLELDIEPASHRFADLLAGLDSNPARILSQQAIEARAIAALALAYPPEIAAYRSFGAPMRRRLYAELLTRESVRLASAGEPPPTPPASPGPDA